MEINDVIYLNVSMPFGYEPSDVFPIGTKATVMNKQTHTGGAGGYLLYVEFEINKQRTWLYEGLFKESL